jgi:hypothetical protein
LLTIKRPVCPVQVSLPDVPAHGLEPAAVESFCSVLHTKFTCIRGTQWCGKLQHSDHKRLQDHRTLQRKRGVSMRVLGRGSKAHCQCRGPQQHTLT